MKISGFADRASAARKAKTVSVAAATVRLSDGSWVAIGDELIDSQGMRSQLVYGRWSAVATVAELKDGGQL